MNKYKFFVYCSEEGFDVFETIDDAMDAADERVKCYLADCWSEDVTSVCVGKITHRAKMCDQVFPDGEIDEDGIDEAGDYWESDCDCKCNYKMLPIEHAADGVMQPSPEVAKLVEALDEMIDIAKRVDGWESFPSASIDRAEDSIRAYRAKMGDL